MEKEIKKHQTKLLSEYFTSRDFLEDAPMWDEAQQEVEDEIKRSIGWPL